MTLLVFLAAPTRAGVVAANFFRATDHLLRPFHHPGADHLHFSLLAPLAPLVLADHGFFFLRRPQQEEIAQRLILDAIHQRLKHIERLALVFHQRIALPVASQPDAFLQVIHRQQMVFPLRIHHLKHNHALVHAHALRAPHLFPLFIALMDTLPKLLSVRVEGFRIQNSDFSPSTFHSSGCSFGQKFPTSQSTTRSAASSTYSFWSFPSSNSRLRP